ncbi:MAG: chromosomal replication initiator protein DnaA [Lachnospiraceae bacterium]|nr:chromosomal replication initiator protein DnaA [Lachnospiraceae bacterium]
MYNELKNNWDNILNKLKNDYDLTDVAFRTWILPLSLHSVKNDTINLVFNGEAASMSIGIIEKKYILPLKVVISEITGNEFSRITISEPNAAEPADEYETPAPSQLNQRQTESNLNPIYNFDSFIVGSNNDMAHAVALAVAEQPGTYNPLFIYGGVGLGKTHLMHAIGNYILENNKQLKVLYTSSESFTNELIDIMRNGKKDNTDFSEFRSKYRSVDVLMIDDIQFIIGKDRTQEEFFHTFNDLYMNQKQIIITSDKPPKDFLLLEDRLKSRFSVGVTVDIKSPEYETRVAILKKRAELKHYDIDDSVFQYIADNIVSNVRELEGALKKITLFANLSNQKITLPLAQDVLKDLINPDSTIKVDCNRIIEIVSEHYGVTVTDLLSNKKTKNIAYPRQICMYLCKELTEETYAGIGKALNRKDHSTIIHGVTKIAEEIEENQSTKSNIDVLIKKINPN